MPMLSCWNMKNSNSSKLAGPLALKFEAVPVQQFPIPVDGQFLLPIKHRVHPQNSRPLRQRLFFQETHVSPPIKNWIPCARHELKMHENIWACCNCCVNYHGLDSLSAGFSESCRNSLHFEMTCTQLFPMQKVHENHTVVEVLLAHENYSPNPSCSNARNRSLSHYHLQMVDCFNSHIRIVQHGQNNPILPIQQFLIPIKHGVHPQNSRPLRQRLFFQETHVSPPIKNWIPRAPHDLKMHENIWTCCNCCVNYHGLDSLSAGFSESCRNSLHFEMTCTQLFPMQKVHENHTVVEVLLAHENYSPNPPCSNAWNRSLSHYHLQMVDCFNSHIRIVQHGQNNPILPIQQFLIPIKHGVHPQNSRPLRQRLFFQETHVSPPIKNWIPRAPHDLKMHETIRKCCNCCVHGLDSPSAGFSESCRNSLQVGSRRLASRFFYVVNLSFVLSLDCPCRDSSAWRCLSSHSPCPWGHVVIGWMENHCFFFHWIWAFPANVQVVPNSGI